MVGGALNRKEDSTGLPVFSTQCGSEALWLGDPPGNLHLTLLSERM